MARAWREGTEIFHLLKQIKKLVILMKYTAVTVLETGVLRKQVDGGG